MPSWIRFFGLYMYFLVYFHYSYRYYYYYYYYYYYNCHYYYLRKNFFFEGARLLWAFRQHFRLRTLCFSDSKCVRDLR